MTDSRRRENRKIGSEEERNYKELFVFLAS